MQAYLRLMEIVESVSPNRDLPALIQIKGGLLSFVVIGERCKNSFEIWQNLVRFFMKLPATDI